LNLQIFEEENSNNFYANIDYKAIAKVAILLKYEYKSGNSSG